MFSWSHILPRPFKHNLNTTCIQYVGHTIWEVPKSRNIRRPLVGHQAVRECLYNFNVYSLTALLLTVYSLTALQPAVYLFATKQ